jgi:hypothetical protein
MYTSIVHPISGKEIQIKTGDDALGCYHIGDKVCTHVHPRDFGSGCCFDGAYLGIALLDNKQYKTEEYWVVIKDSIVYSVILRNSCLEVYEDRESIIKRLRIKCGYRWYWYTPRAMILFYTRVFFSFFKFWFENRKFERAIARLTPEEQLCWRLARPLMKQLNYDSISKKVLRVKGIKEKKRK